MNTSTPRRSHWSSRLSFIMAAAGSAIGLGNIWKFPYITGENGGGAFVLVYLGCIAMVGVPIFIAELYIGQKSQKDTVSAFNELEGKTSPWQIAGWLGILSAFLILSFYSVVGGWVLDYEVKALTNQFANQSDAVIGGMLDALFADPAILLFWHAVFMAMTIGIVMCGISGGIERAARILMPALAGILIFLFIWVMTMDGFGDAMAFLFRPDFGKLTPDSILVAVGHAFFTLSLGMGAMITYGSYLDEKEDLVKIGFAVSLADTVIALVAGIVVFTIVFSFGQEPGAGPGLIFVTLPTLFAKMPGGYLLAVLFFLLVAFAALSSSISLLEVIVTYFVDELGYDRKMVAAANGIAIWFLGILSALSFNLLSDFKVFGKWTFFDLFDGLTANIFMPVGGLLISLFFGWILGHSAISRMLNGRGGEAAVQGLLWSCRVVAPVFVIWVLFSSIVKWVS